MDAFEFYSNQSSEARLNYDGKYLSGKNVIDSKLEDLLLKKTLNFLPASSKARVLEIGVFTGRITKKLNMFFENVYSTEIAPSMLVGVKNGLLFDWVNGRIDAKFAELQRFGFIVSLGMRLSFSQNIKRGVCAI